MDESETPSGAKGHRFESCIARTEALELAPGITVRFGGFGQASERTRCALWLPRRVVGPPPQMKPVAVLLTVLFFLLLFAQFGARLPARRALLWTLAAALLVTTAWRPALFAPLVHGLGIELVSNFVLAAMVLFLFLQMAEQQVETSELRRALLETTSAAAAAQFVATARPKVLVVLPCRNEVLALPTLLPALRRLEQTGSLSWVVVDDASDDGSEALLAREAPDRSVRHVVRLGVSGALLTGFRVADRIDAEWVIQCDADGQHPVERVPDLLVGAAETGADVLVGSRFLAGGRSGLRSTTGPRWVGGRWLGSLLRLFGKEARVTDPTSGFRAYSRRARRILALEMPEEYPEPECIALAALRGLRVREWPVEMAPRITGRSKLGGWSAFRYMVKVSAALLGLRLRSLAP